jgi:hypothetical protein
MGSDEEVKKMITDWFNWLAIDFFDAGIQKLATQYKHLNLHGNYVEHMI